MTHAHDRTLLASLGFADPDKKNPLHDLACQYLASAEIAPKVLTFACGEVKMEPTHGIYSAQEVHVVKNGGFTIGFIDVAIALYHKDPGPDVTWKNGRAICAVEVKSSPVNSSDILRQISLYRDTWNHSYFGTRDHIEWITLEARELSRSNAVKWVVATCYPITKRDSESFKAANIRHVQLSAERIHKWAAEQDGATYEAPEV